MIACAHVLSTSLSPSTSVRYEKLFEPRKWDVIIRILSPPDTHDHIDSSSEPPSCSDTESLPSRDGRRSVPSALPYFLSFILLQITLPSSHFPSTCYCVLYSSSLSISPLSVSTCFTGHSKVPSAHLSSFPTAPEASPLLPSPCPFPTSRCSSQNISSFPFKSLQSLFSHFLHFLHSLLLPLLPCPGLSPSFPQSCVSPAGTAKTILPLPAAVLRCRRCTNTTLRATQW